MLRDWDLSQISDGKTYTENDLAKLGVNDCKGCAKCLTKPFLLHFFVIQYTRLAIDFLGFIWYNVLGINLVSP